MRYAITARELLTPDPVANGVVLVEHGRIVAIGTRDEIELPAGIQLIDAGDVLAPGFIDLHIHGAVGFDSMDADTDGLRRMARFLLSRGVTSFLPTTITAQHDKTLAALAHLASHIGTQLGDSREPAAVPIGIHLEGPFLNAARRGVHPPMDLLAPDLDCFEAFCNAAQSKISLLTIAPELPEAHELIRAAVSKGIRIAIGHSNADGNQARQSIEAGVRHSTHTFNAMRRLEHRDPGAVGVILSDDRLTADIIVDGMHVEPEVVKIFLRCKGRDLAVLVSDSTSATGMPDGRYKLGAFDVEVKGLRCESHGKLAGSVLTLDAAVRNVMAMAQWSLSDAVRLVTANPAKVLGIEERKGTLRPGADADFVFLTVDGRVNKAIVAGDLAA